MSAPRITVIAGPNGAGKSSIAGDTLRSAGFDYYNPDDETRQILHDNPALSKGFANGKAWEMGRDLLASAIQQQQSYSFETTLGGNTMTELLIQASQAGHHVSMWYAALSSAEQHIERVNSRGKRGGHLIPPDKIAYRYDASRKNVLRLLPYLSTLRMFDNSHTVEVEAGERPHPQLILHFEHQQIVHCLLPAQVPQWAKPIVAAAARLQRI